MKNYLSERNNGLFDFGFFSDPFESFFAPLSLNVRGEMKTDVKETDTEYKLSIDLAGFDKKDISVEVQNGYVTVSAEKKEIEQGERYLKRERISSCKRSYYVGKHLNPEDVKAKYENGILDISVPKEEPKKIKSRTIEIE